MLGMSEIASRIVQSTIRTMSVECEKVGGVNLAQGVCDTEVPAVVRQGAEDAIEAGYNQYTRADGIARLREAIARKLLRQNGITADPETEVLVTSGVTGGFDSACRALLNPGDEVILFEPYYGYHYATLVGQYLQAGAGVARSARLSAGNRPAGRGDHFEDAGDRSEHAGQPVGQSCFRWRSWRRSQAIATHHDLFIFTDEIYEHFVYDGRAPHQPGFPARNRGAHDYDLGILEGLQHHRLARRVRSGVSAVDAVDQLLPRPHLCVRAVAFCNTEQQPDWNSCRRSFYSDLIQEYQRKREMICSALRESGMEPSVPAGAYYVLADASVVPGAGQRGESHEPARTHRSGQRSGQTRSSRADEASICCASVSRRPTAIWLMHATRLAESARRRI